MVFRVFPVIVDDTDKHLIINLLFQPLKISVGFLMMRIPRYPNTAEASGLPERIKISA